MINDWMTPTKNSKSRKNRKKNHPNKSQTNLQIFNLQSSSFVALFGEKI